VDFLRKKVSMSTARIFAIEFDPDTTPHEGFINSKMVQFSRFDDSDDTSLYSPPNFRA